eukprot:5028711-Lingulodinium_polyedra.AAC.1
MQEHDALMRVEFICTCSQQYACTPSCVLHKYVNMPSAHRTRNALQACVHASYTMYVVHLEFAQQGFTDKCVKPNRPHKHLANKHLGTQQNPAG